MLEPDSVRKKRIVAASKVIRTWLQSTDLGKTELLQDVKPFEIPAVQPELTVI